MTGWNMPRRSARNVVKEPQCKEKQVFDDSKCQTPAVVADVIDDFVAEAESQEILGNDDDVSKDLVERDNKEPCKVFSYILSNKFCIFITKI